MEREAQNFSVVYNRGVKMIWCQGCKTLLRRDSWLTLRAIQLHYFHCQILASDAGAYHTEARLGLATEANPMQHFTAVNYEFSKQARVVVTGKPFQTSLIFVGGARSL